MKISHVLFAGTVVLNAVLLGLLVSRRSGAPSPAAVAVQSAGVASAANGAPDANRRSPTPAPAAAARTAKEPELLWTDLDSPDLSTLIARLRDAGFPSHAVREIVSARVDALFAARLKEIVGAPANQPYWQTARLGGGFGSGDYEAIGQLYRDRSKLLREVLADPFFDDAPLGALELERRRRLGSLSKDKSDGVQRIDDDYAEMTSMIRKATGGIMLPEDKAQLAVLEREKRVDLAGFLTPQELEEYEMRTSPITSRLRPALTLMDATEEEFRAIYDAQQPHRDVLYPTGPNDFSRWQEVQATLAAQLKTALGAERYADYARSTNYEFQQLNQIALQENVSREAAIEAFSLRDGVARESTRIYDDAALTPAQKRAALQALAQETKARISQTLGSAAADLYIKNARWLSAVANGGAVAFGPDGVSSRVRTLPPAGKSGQ